MAVLASACGEDPRPPEGDVITPGGFVVPSRETALEQAFELVDAFPNLTFNSPVSMIEVGDHMLVAERTGRVYAFERNPEVAEKTLVLDLSAQAIAQKDSGLLALAAHPDFLKPDSPARGQLFAFYAYSEHPKTPEDEVVNRTAHVLRLSRFTVDAQWHSDVATELVLIAQPDKHLWHQGGGLFFHPGDGFLYLSIGDEGGPDCVYETCQRNDVLFGAVLRIDVDQRGGDISHPIARSPRDAETDHYYIPNDNPFVGDDEAMEEVYALGLRNPFRMTHDPVDNQVWIGDVGELKHEEVNILKKGANYQWDIMEGFEAGPNPDPERARPGIWTDPLIAYDRTQMRTVIGGYVYRGDQLPSLYGQYVHADFRDGTLWSARYEMKGGEVSFIATDPILETEYADNEAGISSLAVDSDGGLYVLTVLPDVHIFQLKVRADDAPKTPELLSQTRLFSDLKKLTPARNLTPYTINTPLWSDGSQKRRFMALSEPAKYTASGAWDLPTGTVLVKHFELPLDEGKPEELHRLETRVLVVDEEGVYGTTFKWREDQTDAELLLEHVEEELTITGADGSVRKQTHIYPSPGECLRCHDPAAGDALGIQTAQMNLEQDGHAQLSELANKKLLTGLPNVPVSELPRLASLGDAAASVEHRVRSYLHANCSFCHGAREIAGAAWDARITTPLAEAHILDGKVEGLEGGDTLRIVSPGDLARSFMLERVSTSDRNLRMPPLGTARPDAAFVDVLTAWIESLASGGE